jgi:hypothetical protein
MWLLGHGVLLSDPVLLIRHIALKGDEARLDGGTTANGAGGRLKGTRWALHVKAVQQFPQYPAFVLAWRVEAQEIGQCGSYICGADPGLLLLWNVRP